MSALTTHRLCIGIQKGGVGKTTTAVNLADCLTRILGEEAKVLLIDMDAQRSSSRLLGISDGTAPTVRELLLEETVTVRDVAHPTAIPRLYVIPSSLKLAPVESLLMVPGEYHSPIFRLYAKLAPDAVQEYRVVVIDTPPSMGLLMMNAIAAADRLIVPMESGSGFSFDGIDDLLRLVTLVKKEQRRTMEPPYHTDVQLLGVLLTKHDKRQTLCKAVYQALTDKYGDDVFRATITASAAVKKAEMERLTLLQSNRKSRPALQYMDFALEVMRRLNSQETLQSANGVSPSVVSTTS